MADMRLLRLFVETATFSLGLAHEDRPLARGGIASLGRFSVRIMR